MSLPKFTDGAKVRVNIDGKSRLGKVVGVIPSTKTGRRLYNVAAESNGLEFGSFRSDELIAR